MRVDKEEIGSLGLLKTSVSDEVKEFALKHIASTNPDKIVQNTELKYNDLYWVTALNIIDSFVITPFCKNRSMIQQFRKFRDRTLLSLVSLNRAGRKEIFDALKPEAVMPGMLGMMQPMEKRGLFK